MEILDVIGLIKAAQALERDANVALMYSGLRLPQYRLMNLLAESGQATVSELSQGLKITRATASVTVNELVRAGSVVVAENPSDRRSIHVYLSEHGSQRLQVARSDLGIFISKLSGRCSSATVGVLNAFVRELGAKKWPKRAGDV
jgi:DNA-binding MarR family transcriptional regulator